MLTRRRLFQGVGAAWLAQNAHTAQAQTADYPSRSIRTLVPFSPGASDAQLRVLAQTLNEKLGQNLVIENKPGAGGAIALTEVKRSSADGYTVIYSGSSSLIVVPLLRPETDYRLSDFMPIGTMSGLPGILVARTNAPFSTIPELIKYATSNPEKVTFGSGGSGSASHVNTVAVEIAAKIRMQHIPFKGSADAITALLGQTVDVAFAIPPLVAAHIQSGGVIPLAITTPQRSEFFPKLPTFTESGVPFVDEEIYGLLAPSGTPDGVVAKLSSALGDSLASESFRKLVENTSSRVIKTTPIEFRKLLVEKDTYWKDLFSKNPDFIALLGR